MAYRYGVVWQNLASNGIGDTGAQAICNMLQSNAVISRLNLSRT